VTPPPGPPDQRRAGQRLDKWLWHARVVRTRSAAAELVTVGRVRINRQRVVKPGHDVCAGDVLTIALGAHVRVLRVLGFSERRGNAPEAAGLYEDLTRAKVPPDRQ